GDRETRRAACLLVSRPLECIHVELPAPRVLADRAGRCPRHHGSAHRTDPDGGPAGPRGGETDRVPEPAQEPGVGGAQLRILPRTPAARGGVGTLPPTRRAGRGGARAVGVPAAPRGAGAGRRPLPI